MLSKLDLAPGRECLNLKDLKTGKKKHIISLGQPVLRNEEGYHDMQFCIVGIFKLFQAHFPDDRKGEILCWPKPEKAI
jgi:hypothetical protein